MLAKNVFAKAIVILGVEMLHEKKDKSNKDVVFFTRTDSLWITFYFAFLIRTYCKQNHIKMARKFKLKFSILG